MTPQKIALEFQDSGKEIAGSFSAMIRLGDSLFAGGDEGLKLARLAERDAGARFELADMIDLSKWLDLPKPPEVGKKVKEIDLEGLDLDRERRLFWLLGSHSLKRGRAKPEADTARNLAELTEVKADANRFLLACLPLGGDDAQPRLAPDGPPPGAPRAAQLRGTAMTSDLLDALRKDAILGPLCAAATALPGKDNGLDIEGLACAPGGRLLVGLRGPVVRGSAVVLEILPVAAVPAGAHADRLSLAPVGPGSALYRRHFLDLSGHGIRDLCWQGDDLLILAGPTMSLDAPPHIFRWTGAKAETGKGPADPEKFFWQEKHDLTLTDLGDFFVQTAPGSDHAEALTFLDPLNLALGYDSPSSAYLTGTTLKIDAVSV